MPARSSPRRKRGSGSRVLVGSADHTTNSDSTSAARKRGLGECAIEARPPAAAVLPSPCWKSSPRPRGAAVVATGCLRGRPRPRLGGGEVDSTWRAFPFSATENFLGGAMEKKEKQEGMDRKGRRLPVLIARGGQSPASMITGNHDPLCMQGLVQSVQFRGAMGKWRCPRPINLHAAPKTTGC